MDFVGGYDRILICVNEEDVIMFVSSSYTVRSDLGEGIFGIYL